MNKAKERNTDKARGNTVYDRARLIRAGAIGAGGGVLLSFLLLLLFALIAVKREDPVAALPLLGRLPWLLGGAFSGLLAALLLRERNFLCPLIAGGGYVFCLLLASLGLGDGSVPRSILSFLLCALCILALALLAALAVMPGKQKKNAGIRRRAKKMRRGYR